MSKKKKPRVRQCATEKLKESLVLPSVKQERYNLCRLVLQVNNKPQMFPYFIHGGVNRSEKSERQQLQHSLSPRNGKAAFVRPRVSSPKHWTDFCEILVTLYGVLSFDPHALTTTIGSHETTTKCYNCSQERFVMKVYEVMYFTLFHIYFKDMQNSQFLRNIRLSNL